LAFAEGLFIFIDYFYKKEGFLKFMSYLTNRCFYGQLYLAHSFMFNGLKNIF